MNNPGIWQKAGEWFVHSNLVIVFATLATVRCNALILGHEPTIAIYLFIGFGTLALYSWHGIVASLVESKFHSPRPRARWASEHRTASFFLFVIGCLACLLSISALTISESIVLFFSGIIAALYTGFPMEKTFRLREIPGLKIWVIVTILTLTTTLLPFLHRESVSIDWILLGVARFCFLFAITLPFDVRDADNDPQKFSTIPQTIGVQKSVYLAAGALATFLMILFWLNLNRCLPNEVMIAETINVFLALVLLEKLGRGMNLLIYSFLYEGIMIAEWILLETILHGT